MPRVVNISEAKAQLSALVAQVRAGEPVLIAKAGKPVAVLSAYEGQLRATYARWLGGSDLDRRRLRRAASRRAAAPLRGSRGVNLLLDTHVLLWALVDDQELSEPARRAIIDGRNRVLVSAVNAWEITIKKGLGKLRAPEDLLDQLVRRRSSILTSCSVTPSRAASCHATMPIRSTAC